MSINKKQWIKIIGFIVVALATWLNPSAGILILLLKLCFQVLESLQKDENPEKEERSQQNDDFEKRDRASQFLQ